MILSLEKVSFSYGKTQVIKDFDFCAEEGSFTTLLGASGCGKTTILRLIAGFLQPDSGSVKIDGIEQTKIEPNKRSVGIVFQDYALFPHFSVFQNIAYGLKIRRFSKKQIQEEIESCAEKLQIQNLLSHFPNELSGGQQQRVALARAIVLKPKILLMDEPLSSLDTSLREQVRAELKEIQQKLHLTTIYVTHDQAEAFSLSDKISVMNGGKILREGSPSEIYFSPKSRFVAELTGRANFVEKNGKTILIRPEWLLPCGKDEADFAGIVEMCEFLGSTTRIFVRTSELLLAADIPTFLADEIQIGREIPLKIKNKAEISENLNC